MAVGFHSFEELYQRILPALMVRTEELRRKGYKIQEESIFSCLKDTKWNQKMNLTLCDLVHDILHITAEEVQTYLDRGGFE